MFSSNAGVASDSRFNCNPVYLCDNQVDMGTVDLRSDTVTLPSSAMKHSMMRAELGDDVFGEDPSVNELQELAAAMLGKEAALFISSGTMGNLLGVLVNACRGDEVIADADSHMVQADGGLLASLAGVQMRPVSSRGGILEPEIIEPVIRPHYPTPGRARTALVSIENTDNAHQGRAWPLAELERTAAAARRNHLTLHMDGARMFNAVVATGAAPDAIAACADTVTFCLSKGLGCPVGSVFTGSRDAVAEARKWRRMIGGATRQAGVLAAAGIFALEHMVARLAEDHSRARDLARRLAQCEWLRTWPESVETNIVLAEPLAKPAAAYIAECACRGVLVWPGQRDTVRMVTHLGIGDDDVARAAGVLVDAARPNA